MLFFRSLLTGKIVKMSAFKPTNGCCVKNLTQQPCLIFSKL